MTAESYMHKQCIFNGPKGGRITAMVTACEPCEPFGKTKIPDFKITLRGNSGRTLETTVCTAQLQLVPDTVRGQLTTVLRDGTVIKEKTTS